jgi:hypothetical protein
MGTATGSSFRRRAAGGCTAVVAAAVLTACAGNGGSHDEAAVSRASAASETPPELADGLLQATSFGPEATVVALSLEQLRAGTGLAAIGKGLRVTPEACATAVQGTQPDLDAFDDVAGVSATSGSDVTVEILLRGGPTEGAVAQLAGAVKRCPHARVTSPQLGTTTVDFENLPVPDLGDGAAALRYTTSITQPDESSATVPALVGLVQDGDRLVVLVNAAVPAAGKSSTVDPSRFADLLKKAYQVQADALG